MKWLSSFIVFAVASSGSGEGAQDATAQARADLAPTGKLRVALLPLPHIAVRDKETGQFSGVVVDLGRELAKRLNVPVEFATVNSNTVAVDQVKDGQADFTFLLAYPHWLLKLILGQPTSSTRRVFSCQQTLRFADWTTSMLRDSESLYLRRA
jgi:Bacterial extracellular solute-binding proteins, family 3